MKCARIKILLSNAIDSELPETERQFVVEHLKICSECREFYEELKAMDAEFDQLEPIAVPENFSNKVVESLVKKQPVKVIQWSAFLIFKKAAAYCTVAGVVILSLFIGNFIGRFLFKEFFGHRNHSYYRDPKINGIAESHLNKDGISYAVYEQIDQEVHHD